MKIIISILIVLINFLSCLGQISNSSDKLDDTQRSNNHEKMKASIYEVLVSQDIKYKHAKNYQGERQSLKLDVYQQQKGNKTMRPVIILVHGGGFASGEKGYTSAQGNFYPEMAKIFANHGFVAFSINYRLWPDCPIDSFPTELDNSISDVLAALKWIKRKNSEYNIDTMKIIIAGDSAGGGLVVNTAYRNTQLFTGVIDLWGGLPPYGIQKTESNDVNACPVSRLTPPTCIIHGSMDDVVPYSVSQRLSNTLTVAKVYNELHPLPGAKHYPNNLSDQIFPIMIAFSEKIAFSKNPQNQ